MPDDDDEEMFRADMTTLSDHTILNSDVWQEKKKRRKQKAFVHY